MEEEFLNRALRFRGDGAHFDIPEVTDSGVFIRFVEIDDWLRIMIEVREDTTSDDLRGAIPLALLWRDRLLQWQGPWMRGGDNPFLEELSCRQQSGESYAALATRLNRRVVALLREYADYLKELEAAGPGFKTMLDFYMWQSKSNQYSFEHARGLLRALKLKEEETEELLRAGLENIQAGRPAFESGYPVSRDKLIGTLRNWRKGVKHQALRRKSAGDGAKTEA